MSEVLPEGLQGYQAVFNYILVKPREAEEKIGSIYIPKISKDKEQRAMTFGTVVSAGPSVEGRCVNVGDEVVYAKYAGTQIFHDDQEFVTMRDDDVLLRRTPTQNESEQEHESGRTDTGRTGCGGSGDDVRDGNRCGPATGIRANAGNTDPRTPRRD